MVRIKGVRMIDFKKLADEAIRLPHYNNPNYPPSLYYLFLRKLAMELKPELGVVAGVDGGGCCLNLAIPDEGHVLGIDITRKDTIDHIDDRFPNFTFVLNDSVSEAKNLVKNKDIIDILFLDSIHTYDHTKKEFNAFLPMLRPGSVVCFDDLFRPGMEDFWDELDYPNKVRLDFLHLSGEGDGGFGLIEIN